MTDLLIHFPLWDTQLLLFLNSLHNSFLDGFMYAFSYKITWILFYASVLYFIIRKWKSQAVWVVLAVVICILLSDQLSSGVIKNLVQRYRPSQEPSLQGMVHLVNDYHGGRFGFVSSHAANSLGFALLTSLLFRNRVYTLAVLIWALLTSYSRMYLGVHYPLDILGGMLVGVLCAGLCYVSLIKLRPQIANNEYDSAIQVPLSAMLISFVGIIVYGIVC